MKKINLLILFASLCSMLHAQELVTYDAPGGLKYSAHNDDFTVQVRIPHGEWVDLFEWKVQVDLDNVQTASMVNLDFEGGVEVRHSTNVTVDGPVFINPNHYTIYGGQTSGLTVKDIKSFSCKGWSDGIDLMSCSDVVIDGVFMRNSDDCIAIYGHRWDFYGSARNYQIKNSTLWADIAHPTNVGLHGYAEAGGDTIENITFSNIDILEHDEDDRDYQGCMAITCSDNNLVRNITYEDIRVEDFQEGQLFNFRVVYNEKYSGAPGRGIENVLLKNVEYKGNSANPSVIQGYDEYRKVRSVGLKGLRVNGQVIQNSIAGEIRIGDFVDDVNFKK